MEFVFSFPGPTPEEFRLRVRFLHSEFAEFLRAHLRVPAAESADRYVSLFFYNFIYSGNVVSVLDRTPQLSQHIGTFHLCFKDSGRFDCLLVPWINYRMICHVSSCSSMIIVKFSFQ